MAQMGIALGVVAFILYGALGAWTVYLLVWLYLEHKARYSADGKVQPERHILQVCMYICMYAAQLFLVSHLPSIS